MMNETVLKTTGMEILMKYLGDIDAERFISLLHKEPFDYTKWQRNLYSNMSVDAIFDMADEYENGVSS